MPPKKEEEKKKAYFGRCGNTLKMGIVGLPNVGKSTTFNLLSKLNVPAENYPFCTIEPNKAQVPVPDPRFDKLKSMWKPKSNIQATLSIIDIAGLVRGASEGEGLGNAFLSNIQGVDGIYHVVRAFEAEDVTHTEGDVDPIRDMEIITGELIAKDLQILNKRLGEVEKDIARAAKKDDLEEKATLDKAKALMVAGKWVRSGEWTEKEVDTLNKYLFITSKPVCYLVNLSIDDFKSKKNKWLPKIQEWITKNVPGPIIPYSADFEKTALEEQQLEESKMIEAKPVDPAAPPSMMSRIIRTGYKILELIYFFTAGEDEVRCWTVREGTKAPGAGGVIHTDFEKGFICAEVMKYDDFVRLGSELAVKGEGKYRQQGKEYTVEDGDIIFFKVGQIKK